MSRATHSKATKSRVKEIKPVSVKTSNKVLKSLKDLKSVNLGNNGIEHVSISVEDDTIPEIYKTITDFSALSQKIVKWYEDNEILIRNQDQLALDMLHDFELCSPKDLYRAYLCYSKLRSSRQLRRKAKVENKMLAPLYDYIKKNPTIPKEMMYLSEKCAGIQYDLEHAQYYYKSDLT